MEVFQIKTLFSFCDVKTSVMWLAENHSSRKFVEMSLKVQVNIKFWKQLVLVMRVCGRFGLSDTALHV